MDEWSSVDILFLSNFQKVQLFKPFLNSYGGDLIGFSKERVNFQGYVQLWTTFEVEAQIKTVDVQ